MKSNNKLMWTYNLFTILLNLRATILKIILVFLLLPVGHDYAYSNNGEEKEIEDKNYSPFFFIKGTSDDIGSLPLLSANVDVKISGVIADVTIKQTYHNTGQIPLEAIYMFPSSTKAAVYFMQIQLGNRIINAQIKEKTLARKEYEEAKKEGSTTALLVEKRPNVFQMNVANIMPGDTIEVLMKYTELITPVDSAYEFVFPTVIGPRYGEWSDDQDNWVEIKYQPQGANPAYLFDIDILLNAGIDIKGAESPSHPTMSITYSDNNTVFCSLSDSDMYLGNKDFIFRYILSGDEIESGLLLFEGEEENFFLAMIQPPKSPSPNQILPREYVFIMDVSGSMHGFPMNISKELFIDLISSLESEDLFNVVFFSAGSDLLYTNSIFATTENVNDAISKIAELEGGGGTELLPALQKALNLSTGQGYSRIFVIATDGYVVLEKEAFDLIRNSLGEANFFSFGIGSSVNRYLIEGMAYAGMGEPFIVLDKDEASQKAEQFRQYIKSPCLTNIDISFNGFDAYDVEPISIPDVFANRPVLIYGKWKGPAEGTIEIKGISGNQNIDISLPVSDYTPSLSNSALKYLWARKKIELLNSYNQVQSNKLDSTIIKEIVSLGLKYNLLTRYTSFIAVDSVIRNPGGEDTTIIIPLPLPAGVSEYATEEPIYIEDYFIPPEENEFDKHFSIYPIPVKNSLTIEFKDINSSDIQIEMINMLGQTVYSDNITNVGKKYKYFINTTTLLSNSNTFILKISVGEKAYYKKLILL